MTMKTALCCGVFTAFLKGTLVLATPLPLYASVGTDYERGVRENIEEQKRLMDQQTSTGIIFLIFEGVVGFGLVACAYVGLKSWLARDSEHKRQVLDALQSVRSKPDTVAASHRTCENCSRTIGSLERVRTFESHIVCVECFSRLNTEARRENE